MNLWKFILNRAAYHWLIFFTLIIGVTFATALLASGPLIVNTVLNLSIPYKLQSSDPLDGNLRLTTYERFSREEFEDFDNNIQARLINRLDEYISDIITGGTSGYTYPWIDGILVKDRQITLSYYQGLNENTHLISGEWPIQPIVGDKNIRVVISDDLSNDYQLKIGDKLPLSYKVGEIEPSIWLIISGIITQNKPQDIYWFGDFNNLVNQSTERWSSVYNAFVSEDYFFEINNKYFSTARPELYWNVIIDPYKITLDQINTFNSKLNILRLDVADVIPSVDIATNTSNVLNNLTSRSHIVRITLYILIGEVLFLAIFYITMISTLYGEYLSAEFSNLSSRGSSPRNILSVQMLEALVIGLVAFLIGIMLALVLVWFMVEIGPITEVNHSSWNIQIPRPSLVAACIGILICMLSLLIPIRKALNQSVVIHARERSRKGQPSFWQRFYLDIFVLLIGLILFWRFYTIGGLTVVGWGGSIDWLLLITPLILLISAATIINRVFPILMKGLSILFVQGRSFVSTMALYYISRAPDNVSRLVFFLILTMALGVLTSGINATLDESEYERALYAIGSPVRFYANQLPQVFSDYSIVDAASSTYRTRGSLNIRAYRTNPSFDLLAIDPYTFIKVTKFRSDYASKPMGELLGSLVVDIRDYEYPSIKIHGEPVALGIWILNDTLFYEDNIFIELTALRGKLRTVKGDVFVVNLQSISPDKTQDSNIPPSNEDQHKWNYFEGVIPPLNSEDYPLSLHSLWFNIRSTGLQFWRISLLIDDISIRYQNNDVKMIDDFEDLEHIWQVNDIQADVAFTRKKSTHSGSGSLNLHLPSDSTNIWGVGLFPAGKLAKYSIPVLASEEFLKDTALNIGDNIIGNVDSIPIPMVISESVHYFPTLYDKPGRGFLILPLDPLMIYLNQETVKPFNINELWLNTENIDFINKIHDQMPNTIRIQTIEEERRLIKADPFTLGLRSIITLSFWISVILGFVGFSSHFFLNARSRRVQFGILRSIGMSIRQLYSMLFIEQAILIFFGMTIGLILGLLLNMIILPDLPISLGEQPPVPPFLPHMNWVSIITLYASMTAVFIIVLGFSTLFLWKAEIHTVLRIGME